jgi:hypothetical protein
MACITAATAAMAAEADRNSRMMAQAQAREAATEYIGAGVFARMDGGTWIVEVRP